MFRYILAKAIKKIQIPAVRSSALDVKAKVYSASSIVNSTIDKYTYVGNYCTIVSCNIGKFCSIADFCIIGGAQHPIERVSTSPVFHEGDNAFHKNFSLFPAVQTKRTIIENDVWLGNNCLIKAGVKIGTGAIIGMGAVVTKDVPPYEIWAGVPAVKIRSRFDKYIIQKLLESQWWNMDEDKLKRAACYMDDVEEFLKYVNQEDVLEE
mgnify:CR=1 FL=1